MNMKTNKTLKTLLLAGLLVLIGQTSAIAGGVMKVMPSVLSTTTKHVVLPPTTKITFLVPVKINDSLPGVRWGRTRIDCNIMTDNGGNGGRLIFVGTGSAGFPFKRFAVDAKFNDTVKVVAHIISDKFKLKGFTKGMRYTCLLYPGGFTFGGADPRIVKASKRAITVVRGVL